MSDEGVRGVVPSEHDLLGAIGEGEAVVSADVIGVMSGRGGVFMEERVDEVSEEEWVKIFSSR